VFHLKRILGLSVILAILLIAGFTMAAQPVLRVGTDATYEPFETIDAKGNYTGFDMELIKMVATEMGMKLKLQNIGWDGIIPGLMNGNYDCLISAMTITAERKKQINFSKPYFSIKQVIVVKSTDTKLKTPQDLVGMTIAVQNGTTGDLYASKIKNVKMKRFDTNPQAVQELLNNNAGACVMDDLVGYSAIRKTKGLKVVEIKEVEKEDYGIGVKKGNDKLLAQINKALDSLEKSGKISALITKYKTGK
jgi:ABC-type amino acid transport substrate-binding protein